MFKRIQSNEEIEKETTKQALNQTPHIPKLITKIT